MVSGDPGVETEDLTGALDKASVGVEYELLPHAHTGSAAAEAEALGFQPGNVAQTLVVATPDGGLGAVRTAHKSQRGSREPPPSSTSW